MEDEILRYHGGPMDGAIVELPPDGEPTRIADLDGVLLPTSIRVGDGIYTFDAENARFEWRG